MLELRRKTSDNETKKDVVCLIHPSIEGPLVKGQSYTCCCGSYKPFIGYEITAFKVCEKCQEYMKEYLKS